MSVRIWKEPVLEQPYLVACWPGIGSIGLLAVDTLRRLVGAEEFGEIEPWDFFYPRKAIIRNGELSDLEFPTSKFYYARPGNRDLIFFVGEEQPTTGRSGYAEGRKAYELANMVMDVAMSLDCRRVITSGAAVAPIHHTTRSRVWAVPNDPELLDAVRGYPNTILMSDVEGRGGQGNITGLNGLMLGVAWERGVPAMCVMGEVPSYLQEVPFPYPKASRAVLEVLAKALDVSVDLSTLDNVIAHNQKEIDKLYASFPSEIRDQLDKLKRVTEPAPSAGGPITDEDKKRILEDIDKLFKKQSKED